MMSKAAPILAQTNDYDHMNGWGGGWMWLWGVAMMVLFVVLIVWLVRASDGPARSSHREAPPDPTVRAREILAERYASGDLSTEEYRERVSELQ